MSSRHAVELPVLDAGAPDFPDSLRAACHGPGFFSLTGHGVPESLCAEMIDEARAFFARSEREKLEIENIHSPQFRGYTRLGHERTNGRPDWREQLDFGPESDPRVLEAGEPAYLRLIGPNQWPSGMPQLRDVVVRFMEAMEALAVRVIRAMAVSLDRPADHFDATFARDPWAHLKVIRYPGGEAHEPDQGVGAHKDYGYLAMLVQDETGGLQVASRDGGFFDTPAIPGTFVCNIGEMFEVATGGYYRATVHRVVRPPAGSDRISVPYFHAPRLDARLETIELPEPLRREAHLVPDPTNEIYAKYGNNALKGWLRSHPEVARRYWSDVLAATSAGG